MWRTKQNDQYWHAAKFKNCLDPPVEIRLDRTATRPYQVKDSSKIAHDVLFLRKQIPKELCMQIFEYVVLTEIQREILSRFGNLTLHPLGEKSFTLKIAEEEWRYCYLNGSGSYNGIMLPTVSFSDALSARDFEKILFAISQKDTYEYSEAQQFNRAHTQDAYSYKVNAIREKIIALHHEHGQRQEMRPAWPDLKREELMAEVNRVPPGCQLTKVYSDGSTSMFPETYDENLWQYKITIGDKLKPGEGPELRHRFTMAREHSEREAISTSIVQAREMEGDAYYAFPQEAKDAMIDMLNEQIRNITVDWGCFSNMTASENQARALEKVRNFISDGTFMNFSDFSTQLDAKLQETLNLNGPTLDSLIKQPLSRVTLFFSSKTSRELLGDIINTFGASSMTGKQYQNSEGGGR